MYVIYRIPTPEAATHDRPTPGDRFARGVRRLYRVRPDVAHRADPVRRPARLSVRHVRRRGVLDRYAADAPGGADREPPHGPRRGPQGGCGCAAAGPGGAAHSGPGEP